MPIKKSSPHFKRAFLLILATIIPYTSVFPLPGIEYSYFEIPNSPYFSLITGAQSVHMLEIDPTLYEIRPVKALDDGLGRESALSIANRYGAVASINGGFFSIGGTFDGKACGALKIDDWFALPVKPRGCIGWSLNNPSPLFDRLLVGLEGYYNQKWFKIDGLNRPRKEGEAVLFTPCFHKTTLTHPDGEEVIVRDGIVESIRKKGSSKIPENGFVLSIQNKSPLYGTFEIGHPFNYTTIIEPQLGVSSVEEWHSLDYIVGGTPLLLYKSGKIVDFESELTLSSFLSKKHARTALGILPNGHWIFIVVDKTGLFDGMTISELASLMGRLGCTHALNLDGGGSSTLCYKGGVKNSPHGDEDEGKGEKTVRRVSDAIIVIPR